MSSHEPLWDKRRRWRFRLGLAAVLCLAPWAPDLCFARQDQDAALDRARALITQGRYAAAEKALLSLARHSARADYLRGFSLVQLYRYEEAEAVLRRAVDQEPENHAWLHALAKALIEQSKNVAAIEVLDHAITLEGDPEYHFAKAMCALNTGDLETAETELEICLEKNARHAEALYKLGKILIDRGEYKASLGHLRECLALQLGHQGARFLLGLAASRTGDPETARAAFEVVLQSVPGHVGALYNLGRALIQLGRRAEGLARLEEFRALSPLQDRIDYFSRAVKKNARNFEVRLQLASLLLEAGHTEDALKELLAARQIAPSRTETYRLLAQALRRLGQPARAARAEASAARLEGQRR